MPPPRQPGKVPWTVLRRQWQRTQERWLSVPANRASQVTQFFMGG